MRRSGLRAIYQKPRTTVPGDQSERCPCLLDLKKIKTVDKVWAADITDIPLKMGFLYLVAIINIRPRHVLSAFYNIFNQIRDASINGEP
jgi:putative transposase